MSSKTQINLVFFLMNLKTEFQKSSMLFLNPSKKQEEKEIRTLIFVVGLVPLQGLGWCLPIYLFISRVVRLLSVLSLQVLRDALAF